MVRARWGGQAASKQVEQHPQRLCWLDRCWLDVQRGRPRSAQGGAQQPARAQGISLPLCASRPASRSPSTHAASQARAARAGRRSRSLCRPSHTPGGSRLSRACACTPCAMTMHSASDAGVCGLSFVSGSAVEGGQAVQARPRGRQCNQSISGATTGFHPWTTPSSTTSRSPRTCHCCGALLRPIQAWGQRHTRLRAPRRPLWYAEDGRVLGQAVHKTVGPGRIGSGGGTEG